MKQTACHRDINPIPEADVSEGMPQHAQWHQPEGSCLLPSLDQGSSFVEW